MKKVLLVLLSLFIVGCAGGPKATLEADAQAKQFTEPTDNTANLYIYRNENFGGAINMDILIDDQKIATTGPKTYIMANLLSGEHKIEGIAAEGTSVLTVNLLPNTINFVWQEVKLGVFAARNKLQKVSDTQGRSGVLESRLLLHSQPKKKQLVTMVHYQNVSANKANNFTSSNSKSVKNIKYKKSSIHKRRIKYGSGCDCGSGSYCYGPRGGRYCFTSGGYKRYQ